MPPVVVHLLIGFLMISLVEIRHSLSTSQRKAILFGSILPDIDAIIGIIIGVILGNHKIIWLIHRSFTHSLLFLFSLVIIAFTTPLLTQNVEMKRSLLWTSFGSLIHIGADYLLYSNPSNYVGVKFLFPMMIEFGNPLLPWNVDAKGMWWWLSLEMILNILFVVIMVFYSLVFISKDFWKLLDK